MCRRLFALAVSLAILSFATLPAGAADASLEGTTWVIKDKAGKVSDTLRFRDGRFISMESVPFGYDTSPYQISKKGKWTAIQKNRTNDTLQWQGTWDGKSPKMTGSYVRTTGGGKELQPVKWAATRKKAG
jgi:hypothetical protein